MSKRPICLLALLFLPALALAFMPGPSPRIIADDVPPNIIEPAAGAGPDPILVKFQKGGRTSEIARLHAATNAAVASVIPGIDVTRLSVPHGSGKASAQLFRES